ncbi:MAG: M12 family metallo-peptidase [Planctomycetota bacterium]
MTMIATTVFSTILAALAAPLAAPSAAAPPAAAAVRGPAPRPAAMRALSAEELAPLRGGAGAVSFELDLPGRGAVTVEAVAYPLATEDLEVVIARVDGDPAKRADIAARVRERRVESPQRPLAFVGELAGVADSRVYLGVGTGAAERLVAGYVEIGRERWWLSSGPVAAMRRGLPAMIAHESTLAGSPLDGLRCAAMDLAENAGNAASSSEGGVAGGAGCREFRVAVETDAEFTMVAQGGDTVAATQYALLLMGAASQVYDRDVNSKLPVSYLRLWTGDDPWTQVEMGPQLGEYRDYWAANMGAVTRDVGHYLAGRGLGGGVAWLSVVCTGPSWSYALSSGIGYGYPYPLVDHDHGNWEPMVVMHEMGHNFGAPHTHAHTPPADGRGANDCTLAWEGTIMSYCHICSGGMSNISLKFHPYSIASMNAHLGNVGCANAGARAVDDVAGTLENTQVDVRPFENDAFVNCQPLTLVSFQPATTGGGSVESASGSTSAAPVLRYTPAAGYSGVDTFTYTARESSGATSTATVYVRVRPILDQTYVAGPQAGIGAAWYALSGSPQVLPDFGTITPYAVTSVPQVNYASTGGNFATSGRADLVGAVFEGWIDITATGLWTFSVESDDGSRLLIDGVEVVDNDGLHGMVERSGQVGLERGLHKARVEFFENGGGAGCILRWTPPGGTKQVVPAANLYRGGQVMQLDLDGDGSVAASDLAILLGAWGPAAAGALPDFNRDGSVNASDLGILLSQWGT